jgi:hypothetical protein
MDSTLGLIIVLFIVFFGGGGAFFIIWRMTRPKIMNWEADVYTLASGIQPPILDERGEIISDLKLKDMRPFVRDTLEKIYRKGKTIYYLRKLQKTTNELKGDCVEYWGEKDKRVSILLTGETALILKKGFDVKTAQSIFTPLNADKINLIKSEIEERKERILNKKDIIQAIMPWIVTGILMLGLVIIAWTLGSSWVKASDNILKAETLTANNNLKVAEMQRDLGIMLLNYQKDIQNGNNSQIINNRLLNYNNTS